VRQVSLAAMNSKPSPPASSPPVGRGELRRTARDWLRVTAAAKPDGLALRAEGRDWIYTELDADVEAMAARLAASGIGAGAHVGVLLPNRAAYVLLIHALARVSAVLVALNTRLTAGEVAWQVAAADCTAVICDESTL